MIWINSPVRRSVWRVLPSFAGFLILSLPFFQVASAQEDSEETKSTQSDTLDPEVKMERVKELVEQLEADGLQERDDAEKGLIELGSGILPFLPKVTADTSGELKIRLQRIRESFGSEEMEGFFEASKVNLTGDMKLTEALAAITKQTGNEITLQGEDAFTETEVKTDFKDVSFWNAISELMSQAQLRINTFGTTASELVLGPGGGDASEDSVFQNGPFRVEPTFLQATRQFNNAQSEGQLQVSLNVSWEPRLKPAYMQVPMVSIGAETDSGNVLLASNPQASPQFPLNFGGCTAQIDLQFALPDRSDESLKQLTGEFVVAVPGEPHKYEFKDFANGARQKEQFGDVTVILEGARRNGKVYETRVRIDFGDNQGTADSFRGFILSNRAYLMNKQDKRLEDIGLNTYMVTNSAIGIAYLFQINDDPKDYRLIYESPSAVTKQSVEYDLGDIELP